MRGPIISFRSAAALGSSSFVTLRRVGYFEGASALYISASEDGCAPLEAYVISMPRGVGDFGLSSLGLLE